MLFITHRLQAYFLKRWPPFTSMHCCNRVWKLPYTRLRRSSSIAATSSTMACLNFWIVMIRLRNTRSFRNPHRKRFGTVRSGDRAGQAMSPKLRTQVTRCCTFQRSIATDHMKWRPLNYRCPSRQRRQTIAPAQYSNWNVSVGSAPPCIIDYILMLFCDWIKYLKDSHNVLCHCRTYIYIYIYYIIHTYIYMYVWCRAFLRSV